MASKKIRDLAVKTGSYVNGQGETKNRYKNVGSLMKSDDGSTFILLDKTFNPAGVPGDPDRDNVLISVFELREEGQQQAPRSSGGQAAPQRHQQETAQNSVADDDIPF